MIALTFYIRIAKTSLPALGTGWRFLEYITQARKPWHLLIRCSALSIAMYLVKCNNKIFEVSTENGQVLHNDAPHGDWIVVYYYCCWVKKKKNKEKKSEQFFNISYHYYYLTFLIIFLILNLRWLMFNRFFNEMLKLNLC